MSVLLGHLSQMGDQATRSTQTFLWMWEADVFFSQA